MKFMSNSMITKNKNYCLEFLKFIFALIICYLHLICIVLPNFEPYKNLPAKVIGSANCVEIFFIIAGYFIFFTNKNLKEFIKSKFLRIWPLLAFSIVIAGLLKTFHISRQPLTRPDLGTVLLLQGTGLSQQTGTNGVAWFVCVLFWVSLLYYCLGYIKNLKIRVSLISLVLFILLRILMQITDITTVNARSLIGGFLSVMMIRGLIAVGIGYLFGVLNDFLNSTKIFNQFIKLNTTRIVATILEILSLSLLLLYMLNFTDLLPSLYSYYFIICLFLLFFFLCVNKIGFLSSVILNQKIFLQLGIYSYPIYIMQSVVFLLLFNVFIPNSTNIINSHPIITVIISMSIFIFVGVLSYYAINFIILISKKMIEKIKSELNV